jgi:hypothetical protein
MYLIEHLGPDFESLLVMYHANPIETFRALVLLLGKKDVVALMWRFRECKDVSGVGNSDDWVEFLLRISVGLTPELYAKLLDQPVRESWVSVRESDEAAAAALTTLTAGDATERAHVLMCMLEGCKKKYKEFC